MIIIIFFENMVIDAFLLAYFNVHYFCLWFINMHISHEYISKLANWYWFKFILLYFKSETWSAHHAHCRSPV